MPQNWPRSISDRVRTHMSQIHDMTQVCDDERYESELYVVIDKLLNSIASRRNRSYDQEQDWYLSVAPQPEIHLSKYGNFVGQLGEDEDSDDDSGGEEDDQEDDVRSRLRRREKAPAPNLPKATRVLRSQVGNQVDEVENIFSVLSLTSNEGSAVSSGVGSEPDDTEKRFRTPDFITYLTTADKTRLVVFLHEVKPFPNVAFRDDSTDAEKDDAYKVAFEEMIPQVVEQAQFAFDKFPQDILYLMSMVGLRYTVMRFERSKTPRFGEHSERLERIPSSMSRPKELLNVGSKFLKYDFDDFGHVDLASDAKRWWSTAINVARRMAAALN